MLFADNASAYTPARGNVQATLSPYIFQTNYSGIASKDNVPNTGGLALVATGDVSDTGALEVAAIYMNKIYFLNDGVKSLAEKTQLIHISMGYRHYLNPYLSTSLGLFTSYPMGDTQVVRDDFLPADNKETTARALTETGLDLAVQAELWGRGRYAVVLEGRYSFSITKKSDEAADQYGVALGLRYFIQGKEKDAAEKAN